MREDLIKVSMTTFADFVAADPMGQAAKLRDIRRQYLAGYRPSEDFWSRWREGVEEIHRQGGTKQALDSVALNAKDNREGQYRSACTGYMKFWGKRQITLLERVAPTVWRCGQLEVKVNPEWRLRLGQRTLIVKLHLKQRVPLNKRLANPLLYLLEQHFSASEVDGVAIVDVHRGKLYEAQELPEDLDTVLRMQASAFITGWLQVFGDAAA